MRRWIAAFTVTVHLLALCPAPAAVAAAAARAAAPPKTAGARAKATTTSASGASKAAKTFELALLPVAGDGAGVTTRGLLGQFLRKRITDSGFSLPADAAVRSALVAIEAKGGECRDAPCAARAGTNLGAQRIVLALVSESGGRARLELSAVEVSSGQETFSEFGDAPNEDALMMTLAPLANRLISHLKEPPNPPGTIEAPAEPEPAAPRAAAGASTLRIQHQPVGAADPDQAIAIEARVTPSLGGNMLFVLHRAQGESSFKLARMTAIGPDNLHAEIPAAAAGARIEYCIRALDASGKQVAREPAGEAFFEVVVGGEAPAEGSQTSTPPSPVSDVVSTESKDQTRAAKEAAAAADRAAAREKAALASTAPDKKGGGKKWLWIGAGVAAVGLGAALAGGGGGGGGSGSGPPSTPPAQLPQPPGRP